MSVCYKRGLLFPFLTVQTTQSIFWLPTFIVQEMFKCFERVKWVDHIWKKFLTIHGRKFFCGNVNQYDSFTYGHTFTKQSAMSFQKLIQKLSSASRLNERGHQICLSFPLSVVTIDYYCDFESLLWKKGLIPWMKKRFIAF